MKYILKLSLAACALLALASCGSTPRRVSPPSIAIQQLTVQADGDWLVELRLHNYSSVSMRFDSVSLEVSVTNTLPAPCKPPRPFPSDRPRPMW